MPIWFSYLSKTQADFQHSDKTPARKKRDGACVCVRLSLFVSLFVSLCSRVLLCVRGFMSVRECEFGCACVCVNL
jgi:hypothetical protein